MKEECVIVEPNITMMMTGVASYCIRPRSVTLRYEDGTLETRKGKHPFKVYKDGDDLSDFNAFTVTSWVQAARESTLNEVTE